MSLGPNATLIDAPDARARLATPCLLLDAEAFEHNLAAMMELVRRHGRQLRPHVKAHKCAAIARRQLEAGAVGLCCATVREAEVMAAAGLDGLLVTSPVTAPGMVERLARARERVDLAVVVDSEAGVEALAAGVSADRPLGAVVEIDVGQGRTGVTRPEDAVRLARRIEGAAAAALSRRPGLLWPPPARAGVRRPQGQGRRAVGPAAAVSSML